VPEPGELVLDLVQDEALADHQRHEDAGADDQGGVTDLLVAGSARVRIHGQPLPAPGVST
jgi:hypothetical protein